MSARFFRWFEQQPEGRRDSIIGPLIVAALIACGGLGFWGIQRAVAWLNAPPDVTYELPKELLEGPGFLAYFPIFQKGQVFAPADNEVAINIHFLNRGTTQVRKAKHFVNLYVAKPLAGADKAVRDKFQDELKVVLLSRLGHDLDPGESLWSSVHSGRLNVAAIVNGQLRIYVLGHAEWTVDDKPDSRYVCQWIQPPKYSDVKPNQLVWHLCS